MKILAVEKEIPNVDNRVFEPHLEAEASKVWELYQTGRVREAYFRRDCSKAVLMLECDDVEEAHEILQSLPLVHEGLIAFDVIPLKPYTEFQRLFDAQQKLVVTVNSKIWLSLFL